MPRVPAVAVADRAVHGWNPQGYADLLGVTYKPSTQLSPQELATRIDRILESAQTLISSNFRKRLHNLNTRLRWAATC